MSGSWHRAVSLTAPRRQERVAVFDAAPRLTGTRWLVERKHRCLVNHCEIVGLSVRREGKRVLCHAGFHALSSSSFENEGDGQTGVAALREFVDKNYIPIALLCAAMLGYVMICFYLLYIVNTVQTMHSDCVAVGCFQSQERLLCRINCKNYPLLVSLSSPGWFCGRVK